MLCEELLINGSPTRSSYTVCQHTVLAFKENRLPPGSFDSCATAIRAGKCRAVKMMLEEVKTGERIYFIDGLEEMRKLREKLRVVQLKAQRATSVLRRLAQSDAKAGNQKTNRSRRHLRRSGKRRS
jgi:hypothetical protein